MRKTFSGLLIASAAALLLSGCAEVSDLTTGLVPDEAHIQPYSLSGTISARSRAVAMKAAVAAASTNEWAPKTVANDTGYLQALRTNQPVAGVDPNDVYVLEVYLPQNGTGEVNIRVAPPRRVMVGVSAEKMASDYLVALKAALPK
jgi:type IV pilus biogenesis protein CpaD/CtpE